MAPSTDTRAGREGGQGRIGQGVLHAVESNRAALQVDVFDERPVLHVVLRMALHKMLSVRIADNVDRAFGQL